jgi:putative sterol carrier protein
MSDATAEFFARLAERGHEPRLEKAKGSIRIDLLDGKPTTRWLVTIAGGDVGVSHRNAAADCTLRMDKGLFEHLASGEVNGFAAVLRGAIEVDGDPALLVLFQRLLPGPPGARGPRRGAVKAVRQR